MLHSTMCPGAADPWAGTCRRRCKGGGEGREREPPVWGRAVGAVWCPSALLAARTACMKCQRAVWARTARAGCTAHAGGVRGGSGGQGSCLEGGVGSNRTPAGHTALLVHGRAQGVLGSPPRVLGPTPGDRWSPPFVSCVRETGAKGAGGQGVGRGQKVRRGRSVTHAMPCGYRG